MNEQDETVLTYPRWVLAGLWTVPPLLGAAAGALIRWVVVSDVGWLPLPGWVLLINRVPEPWLAIGLTVAGLVAGLAVSAAIHEDRVTIRLSPRRVKLAHGDEEPTELARTALSAVYFDRDELVLLGRDGEELARQACDLDREAVVAAFRRHGYPWYDQDPHANEYRRWVPGLPELPAGADALLRARKKALQEQDRDEAAQLRQELARRGLAVRDDEQRQFWRRHPPREDATAGKVDRL